MINKTVSEDVNSSNSSVHDEIHLLKSTVDNQVGEIQKLKTSFNTQLQSLSDKETRHHVESNLKVKEELDKISVKITNFDRVQNDLVISNSDLKIKTLLHRRKLKQVLR